MDLQWHCESKDIAYARKTCKCTKSWQRKQAATKGKKANPSPAYLLVATSIVGRWVHKKPPWP